MTVYSKYFTSGILLRRQAVLINFDRGIFVSCGANTVGGRKFLCAVTSNNRPGVIERGQIRFFRWDAKPDNVLAQSAPVGKNARFPRFFIFITLVGLMLLVDWDEVLPRDSNESYLPKIVQFLLRLWSSSNVQKKEIIDKGKGTVLTSMAGDFYDRYGDAGVDALKEAWEMAREMEGSDMDRMKHVVMMAEAKLRYISEVEKEARELGLEDEPEAKISQSSPEGRTDAVPAAGSKGTIAGNLAAKFTVKAEAVEMADDVELLEEEGGKVEKLGFRDRKIIEYENRIRQYSTPDKVFRYFATCKLTDDKGNTEVMMTPEDFLRSISPGEKQPENLGLDQYHQVNSGDVTNMSTLMNLQESSIFYELGAGGLISFSDYIFLLTVLSTSRRHFEIAFKMFDLNGDGTVDAEEFEKVNTLLRSTSSTGARHRDHGNTGSTFKGINSGLIAYFFGEEKKGTLTVDRFLDFQLKLQEEMLALEFKRKDNGDKGRITERDFADLLIAYAGFSTKKKQKMLRRVKKSYDPESSPGISLKDYLNFYQVLYCINDIDTALTFHTIAGAPIERSTMKHVSRTVAHVELSDHLVDVVFTLFDDNGDGMLSNKEFVSVMKQRAKRGLEKPKEIGISRVFSSVAKCAADCRPAIMGGIKKTE